LREKSPLFDRLQNSRDSRAAYIRAKVATLIYDQLHALRLKQPWTQSQFAHEAGMKQSRVSAMEQPGAVNFNMETLIRSAATFGVGLVVKFVPFSDMLFWENSFNQDVFDPVRIHDDVAFLGPQMAATYFAQGELSVFFSQSAEFRTEVFKQLPERATETEMARPVQENYNVIDAPQPGNESQTVTLGVG
jgi:transcriptional regulator with XRE-family HTH domain